MRNAENEIRRLEDSSALPEIYEYRPAVWALYFTILILKACAYISTISLHERHTSKYISKLLFDILKDWNIHNANINAVITDNAINKIAVRKCYLIIVTQNMYLASANTVTLVAEKILFGDEISKFVAKIREIAKCFKKSVLAIDSLYKAPNL